MISRDGIAYLETARQFAAGDLVAFQRHTAPGFPLLVSLVGRVSGVGEDQAIAVAALCGVASVLATALLCHRLAGPSAARLGACLAAFLPLLAELGGEVLSEPLFLATLPWTLYALAKLAGPRSAQAGAGWGLVAGLSGGLGYLARPEGILVLVAGAGLLVVARRGVPVRRRISDLAWLAWPALLVVLAFMIAIRSEGVLGGSQAGAWKLTLKRNLGYHLSQWSLGAGLANLGEQLRRLAQALWPALGFGVALACLGRRRWAASSGAVPEDGRAADESADLASPEHLSGEGPAIVRQLLVGTALALLAAYVAIRPDRRYAAPLALLLVPLLGEAGARWLRDREPAARRGRLALLLVPLLVTSLVLTLRPRRAAKASYREAGRALKERGATRVLAHDSRVAYYAEAQALELIWLLPDEPREPVAIARVAHEQRADAVVVLVRDSAEVERAEALGLILGRPGQAVQAAGGLPLRVYWLGRP